MKTKNYKFYFNVHWCWYDCALPLRVNLESISKDYTEINLQMLCFSFDFARIFHKYAKEFDNMFKIGECNNG
jgi:hypothetical protein